MPEEDEEEAPRPIPLSALFGVEPSALDELGAFDAVLNLDSPLFLDPALLRDVDVPELETSRERVKNHFIKLLAALSQSKERDDIFWTAAATLLVFPEAQSLCIGYARRGTRGSGTGAGIRDEVIEIAWEILQAGRREPLIFEIIGLFQPKVGPDRISDMIAGIIAEDLAAYTRRVLTQLGVSEETRPGLQWERGLPVNPFNRKPIHLAPISVLDELPLSLNKRTYLRGGDEGATRDTLNKLIREAWADALQKESFKDAVLRDPALLDELLTRYQEATPEPYDFERDEKGHRSAHRHAVELTSRFPLRLALNAKPTIDEVEALAMQIVSHFKTVVEDNGIWRLLYDNRGRPLHEKHAQGVFFVMADIYCAQSDLELSPEVNSGRGSLDFKISGGYHSRVIIEVKLTTNQQLNHGLRVQLNEYGKAEKTDRKLYLVIDVKGAPRQRLLNFARLVGGKTTKYPMVIRVDGTPRASASKF